MNDKYKLNIECSTLDFNNITITKDDNKMNIIEQILLNIFGPNIIKRALSSNHNIIQDDNEDNDEDTCDEKSEDILDSFDHSGFLVDITELFLDNIDNLDDNKKKKLFSDSKAYNNYNIIRYNKLIKKCDSDVTKSIMNIDIDNN
jgi:hypothetical protein